MRSTAIIGTAALLALGGCESTALSLVDPSAANAELAPQYISGSSDEVAVTVTLLGVDDPSDAEGAPQERLLLDYDLGDRLDLAQSRFLSNFRFEVVLQRYADTPPGPRTLSFQVRNHYGTFVASGEFYIFE